MCEGILLIRCSEKFLKNDRNTTLPESLSNKTAGPLQIFTGDLFINLLELSMVFDPIKKSRENVYISLKTKSKNQVTYLLEN